MPGCSEQTTVCAAANGPHLHAFIECCGDTSSCAVLLASGTLQLALKRFRMLLYAAATCVPAGSYDDVMKRMKTQGQCSVPHALNTAAADIHGDMISSMGMCC
jgi:hypothetical protein